MMRSNELSIITGLLFLAISAGSSIILFLVPAITSAQTQPSCTMSASPTTSGPGAAVTLSWDVQPYSLWIYQTCYPGTIEPGGISVAPGQTSVVVYPTQSTTYTGTFYMGVWYNGTCSAFSSGTAVYPTSCSATVTVDPCPTPIESYWGAGNYLFWASATRRINAAGVNVCATNNSSSPYFVPGRTYGELQSFINAAGRLGVSIF